MRKTKQYKRSFTFNGKRYYAYGHTWEEAERKKEARRQELLKEKSEANEREITKIKEEGSIRELGQSDTKSQENTQLADTITVAEWYERYLKIYKVGIKEITLRNFDYKMKNRVISRLGAKLVKDVRPIDCQEILSEMTELSSDYIKKVYLGMHDLFEKARINKIILENPTDDLIVFKGTKTTRRGITEEERKIILDTIMTEPRFVYFAVMLFCGLRPSEVAGLKGKDVWENGMLHVRGTKSVNANRLIPIPKALKTMLPKVEEDEFLFVNSVGKYLDEYGRRHLWDAFRRQLNITAGCKLVRNQLVPPYPIPDDLVPYCLRHTYCTDLQKAGVDIRTAQYLMGHSSIALTANVYTHIDSMQLETARGLIDESLKNMLTGYFSKEAEVNQ